MIKRLLAAMSALVVIALCVATCTAARAAELYDRIGWWQINAYETSCAAIGTFKLDQAIGINPGFGNDVTPTLLVSSPGVDKLRSGQDFPITIQFGQSRRFTGIGRTKPATDDGRAIMVITISEEFIGWFVSANDMYINASTRDGQQLIASVTLQNTYVTLTKVEECQQRINAGRQPRQRAPRNWHEAERAFTM